MSTITDENNLLVFGYVRENTVKHFSVPIALIKLVEAFNNEMIEWTIPRSTLKTRNSWNGPEITVKGIKFQLIFEKRSWRGFNFGLKIDQDSVPWNISSFEINIKMEGKIFQQTKQKKHRLQIDKMSRYDLKHTFGGTITERDPFFKNSEDITARFCVELLNMNYIKMAAHSKCNWILNSDEITAFRQKATVSKIFNNFNMCLTPFGRIRTQRGDRVLLEVKPLLPLKIKSFDIKCKVEMEADINNTWKEGGNFSEEGTCVRNEGIVFSLYRSIFLVSNTNKVSISVDVNITKMDDWNGKVSNDQTNIWRRIFGNSQ